MALGGVLFLPLGGVLADIDCRVPFLIYTGSVLLLPAMVLSLPEALTSHCDGKPPDEHRGTSSDTLTTSTEDAGARRTGHLLHDSRPGPVLYRITDGGDRHVRRHRTRRADTRWRPRFDSIRSYASVITTVALTFAFMSAGYVLVGLSGTCSLILLGLIVARVGTGLLLPNLNMWLAA
jgi:hypothetical protein